MRLYLLLLKDTHRCCPGSVILPFSSWVAALPQDFQLVVKELCDFLVAEECGELRLLSVLPSSFHLRNSIPSGVWLRKVQHSGVAQWCFSDPELSSTQVE